jgi:hypothetical protein
MLGPFRIFEKIRKGPNGILRGLGEIDSRKKPEVETLLSLSLYIEVCALYWLNKFLLIKTT